ncbi:MAG: DUF4124 domain-containing protein [Gammaproteobacteria bacterium]|nr:DUF4124 domain-containing protein [Gammaproteobacteria bacterium]
MTTQPLLHSTAIFLIILSFSSSAGNIYTWTDKQGETHYGDRVPPDFKGSSSILKRGTSLSHKAQTSTSTKALQEKLATLNKRQNDSAEQKKAAKQQSTEREQLKKDCALARGNLKTIQERARIRVKDEQGEYRYISDEEKNKKEAELKEKIKEFCSK